MGCSCKLSPLEKLERKLATRGWNRLYPSETAIIDAFIFDKLSTYPSSPEERYDLYRQAKVS